ncbi:MAG: tetratricopeptide repeat protein, partial [Candidatus Eisenbacteria bacterium]|nr:tetratricopeptide repeat protein [Candidatus Eisenbacteria bacterium]
MLLSAPALGTPPPDRVAERLAAARSAYDAGTPQESLRLYREILAAGWASPQLYYNLGCASYRAGKIPWAVAYFEQARRWAPRDPEIRHNLRVARAALAAQPPAQERSALLDLLTGALDAYTPADAVRLLLLLFWAGALLVAAIW